MTCKLSDEPIVNVTFIPAKGAVVSNLGLPVWLYEQLLKKYEGHSIHYAIQKELKSINKRGD